MTTKRWTGLASKDWNDPNNWTKIISTYPGPLVRLSELGLSPQTIASIVWAEDENDEAQIKEPEPQNFPRWQPVKCPEESCGWQGPAGKATRWQRDQTFYCPKCGMKVMKHESQGSNPS